MRGPVAPPQVPLSVSRSDAFVDLVHESATRLERRWPQLAKVEYAVVDVPPGQGGSGGWADDGAVPLGRLVTGRTSGTDGAGAARPDRIVIYRRPVEFRTKNRDERAMLVHEVIVEQVAELLGVAPESVDPHYGQE